MSGTVYLIGVGPGNAGLLTVRAVDILSRVGAVLAPPGVPREILAHAADAEVEILSPSWSPAEIAERLVALGRRHSAVARLYPGDAVLHGAGGEEARHLASAGTPFEIVAGITLIGAAAGSAGIPATGPEGRGPILMWVAGGELDRMQAVAEVVDAGGSVAIQGDAAGLEEFLAALKKSRLAARTPVAWVHRATRPDQVVERGPLEEFRCGSFGGEAVVLVGRSAAEAGSVSWFEERPLFGRRIVVTRPRAQAAEFVAALEDRGASVIAAPMIRIVDPPDPEALLNAARAVEDFDWVGFTSANAVRRFWEALRAVGRDTRALGGVSICAIGAATAEAIQAMGAGADLLPDEFVAESVADAFLERGGLRGARVLLPRAEIAREILPRSLRDLGAEVTEVVAYRTVPDGSGVERLREVLAAGKVDVVTFTSSSTVRNFAELVSRETPGTRVASIGPVTSATARELGWEVAIEAREHTANGLVRAIVEHFQGR